MRNKGSLIQEYAKKTRDKNEGGWPARRSTSNDCTRNSSTCSLPGPRRFRQGPEVRLYRDSGRVTYFAGMAIFLAAAGFLWWAIGMGLRGITFTADSSTGVVPVTSVEKVAPAGTR